MRAAVMVGHGGPDQLVVGDVAVPSCGSGEVRVAVSAAAVNNTDIWTREGAYGAVGDPDAVAGWLGVPIDVPRVQGADVAGVVESVGIGVPPDLVGRRVLVDPARYDGGGDDASVIAVMGSEFDGGFAEFVVVDAARVHDVTPSPLTDVELAALPIAYGTAMGMLSRASARPGETVVVTGASGGVGMALVQLAGALGLRVIAVSTAARTELLLDHGAAAVIDRSAGDLAGQVRAAAGGAVDLVADVVGGSTFGVWPGLLRTGGRIVVAGAIAGPVVSFDLRQLYLHQRTVIGSTMHSPAHFEQLVDFARQGSIRPVVAATFPLDRIHEAQSALRAPETIGKVVIDVAGGS